MKWVIISIVTLCFALGCQTKNATPNEDDFAMPLPDSVKYDYERHDSGISLEFQNWETDSVCIYHRLKWASGDSSSWFEICSMSSNWNTFFLKGDTRMFNPKNTRAKTIEMFFLSWKGNAKFTSEIRVKYGFDRRMENGVLELYDSTHPIIQPESLNCNQAVAAFRSNSEIDSEKLTSVTVISEFDGYCIDSLLGVDAVPMELIEFSGTYNEAATELERVAPLSFINILPWCEGLKQCGGGNPPI